MFNNYIHKCSPFSVVVLFLFSSLLYLKEIRHFYTLKYFQIYNKFSDEVTVFMGPENGRRFFTVDKYHGKSNLGIWDDLKCDSVQGSSEGVTYHQFVSKNDTLKYLRKTMCRVTPLKYKSMPRLKF